MSEAVTAHEMRWYRMLDGRQWSTLIAANLGWMFDGYETYAVILCAGAALRQLLEPSRYGQIPTYVGFVLALTLLGWGIGGLIGGVIADYLGRKRTMMLAILAYSLMTGISAWAWDWVSFAVLRFLVGLAIGSEWVTGVAIVSELWPARLRARGAGLMQCGFGIGYFLAAFAWFFVGATGPDGWRIMFLIGVLPALMTVWVRRKIPESERWERVRAQRRAAEEHRRSGATLGAEEQALARMTVVDLFADREVRRRIILAGLVSLSTTLAFWGVGAWIPPYVAGAAATAGLDGQEWASYAAMLNTGASVIGLAGFGFLADAFGRKPATILFVVAAFLSVPLMFVWADGLRMMLFGAAVSGVFVTGQYTWMAAWLPELFPTRMRATAASFVFNAPRLIAWPGPIISGWIVANVGGFSHAAVMIALIYIIGLAAAVFLPETRGEPLPA
jgi:MFS family permease